MSAPYPTLGDLVVQWAGELITWFRNMAPPPDWNVMVGGSDGNVTEIPGWGEATDPMTLFAVMAARCNAIIPVDVMIVCVGLVLGYRGVIFAVKAVKFIVNVVRGAGT